MSDRKDRISRTPQTTLQERSMTITTEEAEAFARQLENNEPGVSDPVAIEFFSDVATALRALAAERDQMAKDLDAREIAHMATSVGIDSLTERLEKSEKARKRAEAEAERRREALHKIAGNKTYADDPWSIARAVLEGGRDADQQT